jgi:hypothetical protein
MKNKNSPAKPARLFLFCSVHEPANGRGKYFDPRIMDGFTRLIEHQKWKNLPKKEYNTVGLIDSRYKL